MRNKVVLIIICFLTVTNTFSQIKVSEFIQESKLAETDTNALYFIDFWATWCVPCITAKEQLGVLQKQFPNDFYIVSISEENPLTVERFLKKKPAALAIAIDYYGDTFKAYNVKALPHGILFNARGDVLWEGRSPDLKPYIISNFLRQHKTKIGLRSFFQIISIEEERGTEYIPKATIEYELLTTSSAELEVVDNVNYVQLTGSLKQILSYSSKININQINLPNDLNANYEVYFKKPFNVTANLAYNLIIEMGYDVERKTANGEVINLETDASKLWDTNQINWGENTTKYLIGDSQIKADNLSLKDIAYHMSNVLSIPVITPDDSAISLSKHDWDFHYKFFQLMKSDLEDNYGITAEKKTLSYPVYYISKKGS